MAYGELVRASLVFLFLLVACGDEPGVRSLRVVTFNVGGGAGGADDHPDGFTELAAEHSDTHYGNGLAWRAAIEATRAFFATTDADVVALQEIFHPEECAAVPPEARAGFVCEDWAVGDAFVTQQILGPDFQVACHLGKSDKCVAVRRSIGRIRGCGADVCLDHLAGGQLEGCGRGSRVGRAEVELLDAAGTWTGEVLTVVSVHGSSGFGSEDVACRERQFAQVFEDLGDGRGEPGTNGNLHVVLGDFNTDPGRAARLDASARRLNELADAAGFAFVSEVGPGAPGSYGGAADIDHVLSDRFVGACAVPGITEGPRVYEPSYFDHAPIVCDLMRR